MTLLEKNKLKMVKAA